MELIVREVRGSEVEAAVPQLLLAEPSEPSLRWSRRHMADTVYGADGDGRLMGAVTLRWNDQPPEILALAVADVQQGRGLGRRLRAWLADEAHRRGKRQLVVGTPNSSLGTIACSQQCGLPMDHVRRDYFRYERQPRFENGIQKRDRLVFRLDLHDGSHDEAQPSHRAGRRGNHKEPA